MEERNEKIETMKTMKHLPKPVDSSTGRWNILTRIPVFKNRPKTEPSNDFYRQNNYNLYTDPYIPNRTKVPMSNRLTKWSLDGRLVNPRQTEYHKPQTEYREVKPERAPIEGLNKFGKDNNFNQNDQLGPWILNKSRKSQEVFRNPPPTPSVSKKYIFSKSGTSIVNPKRWFETDTDNKEKQIKLPSLTSNTNLPRWRI
jgi:hypothetical protein